MICLIEGCSSEVKARGLCNKHHRRLLRHGSAFGGSTPRGALEDWLVSHLDHRGVDCLIWPFSRDGHGYGQYKKGMFGEKKVHRIMCTAIHGSCPDDKSEAAHSCGNGHGGCSNPSHLRWATREENQSDREIHGTDNKGVRHGNARLNDETVREIRLIGTSKTQREISELFGVSQPLISAIINRKRWSWLE